MKIDLRDAAFYGAWCSEREREFDILCWFEKSSFQFFYVEKLINEFGYKDCNEIEESGYFVPVFKTDIVALKKEFVANLHLKEVENELQAILEYNAKHRHCTGYDAAFNIFCEEHEDFQVDYQNYEQKQLLKEAEIWCNENAIPYYTPNDPERKLNLEDSLLYCYGGECRDEKGGWKKFEFWFCKNSFNFISPVELEAIYGYKTFEEIILSKRFVPLHRVDASKIKEDYTIASRKTNAECAVKQFIKNNQEYRYEEALWFLVENTEPLCREWMKYEEAQLLKYAERWAIENSIPYYIPKGRPDHLGSQFNI